MSYRYGDSISKDGIKKADFQAMLDNNKKLSDKDKKAAMDIFSQFASLNGNKDVLEESEQIQARAAFASIDADHDGEITNKEFKTGAIIDNNLSGAFLDKGKKGSELFMNIFDSIVGNKDKKQTGEVQFGYIDNLISKRSKPTTYYDQNTPEIADDKLTTYTMSHTGRIDGKQEIKEQNPVKKPEKPEKPEEVTEENITKAFFQYLTGNKYFSGTLENKSQMALPAGCAIKKDGSSKILGIEFGGKLYTMRGTSGNAENPLRFECDETKKTLQEALSETKSDDAEHKYHNHGDRVNSKSSYDATKGEISHGSDETAVSETQTFSSMLMNGNENSTLKLDKQKSAKGETETTGETILKTINTNNDNGIDLTELVSYLDAAQKEAKSIKNQTGARKFAGGIDLDAKDLANIGKVFKKYDKNNDGQLDKDELNQLLTDLKQNSMSKLAGKDNDKYIGDGKPKEDKPVKTKPKENTKPKPTPLEGNRKRYVKDNNKTEGNGQKEQYYYKKGLRTKVENETVNGNITTVADNDSNIAVIKNPLLGKKKFLDIKGLEQNVDARVKKRTVDGNEDQQIVQVKDSNKNIKYYSLQINSDGTYQLGSELITKSTKGKDKYVTKHGLEKDIRKKLDLPDNAIIPIAITADYDDKGTLNIYLNNGPCKDNVAKAYIIRRDAQLRK